MCVVLQQDQLSLGRHKLDEMSRPGSGRGFGDPEDVAVRPHERGSRSSRDEDIDADEIDGAIDQADDADDGEEEEEEPLLKYKRLVGVLPELLANDTITCARGHRTCLVSALRCVSPRVSDCALCILP